MTSNKESNILSLEFIEYHLGGVKYHLKRNQITKAYDNAVYCCEVADELLEENI